MSSPLTHPNRKRNEKRGKSIVVDVIQDDRGKKPTGDFGSKSMNEYLLGSRKLKAFPVAMSLVARYVFLFAQ